MPSDRLRGRTGSPLEANKDLVERGTPQAPNGYAPAAVDCPSTRPSIRQGDTLSQNEVNWLPLRRNATIPAMQDLLRRIDIPDFSSDEYMNQVRNNVSALPNIGLAISGGGYRAMLNGAGALAAWDNRTTNATGQGQLGGLLQASTYLSALSGGGWLVGSLYMNNFTTVETTMNQQLPEPNNIWQTQNSILAGMDAVSLALVPV